LIGEHTDYNGGFVLPMAIAQRALVALVPRDDGVIRIVSEQRGRCDYSAQQVSQRQLEGWGAYVAGVIALAGGDWGRRLGADVVLDSSIPAGAGLSSSAAVECATAIAMSESCGAASNPMDLAKLSQRAEVEVVGVPCGLMDQACSMCARKGHALLLDCRSLEIRHTPLDLDSDGLTVMIINTGVAHELSSGEYAVRRSQCEEAARVLGVDSLRDASVDQLPKLEPLLRARASHVLHENDRVQAAFRLLRRGDVADLGPLLNASHASLRDDYEVSCEELDAAQEAAIEAGALGARMVGGGFGGSVLALARRSSVSEITEAAARAFADRGWAAPTVMQAEPSAGARRLSINK
jgi:galactokinase